ncbi:hypothetical protein HXX76_005782 [Chlamydomonas incerta]|uniref:phytol kinase n=1 Tax=Chlamydomonas incerta TaxID=51695 RepID=A0A835W3Q3_CHLIN|nr:hypothetical protein HXX76_005782 [Chlamydomonas incerta]|eukprot:KAG2438175.1 hypothetical protein HXX76_005782 [Chlamydomonas incerta]
MVIVGALLQTIPECMGVYQVPCRVSTDFNLALYREFVKAVAESHVLDHACRVTLRLLGVVATPAPARERRHSSLNVTDLMDYMRIDINTVICKLEAPLAGGEQSPGALHPRPLAAPRSGTDPALLALLPAVRGVLSGTGVQVWVAKQLLDVANAVAAAEEGVGVGVGGSAEGGEPGRGVAGAACNYLGMPPAARAPPHLLWNAKAARSRGPQPAGAPGMAAATKALAIALDTAGTVWQVTVSGPIAPVMATRGVQAGGGAAPRGAGGGTDGSAAGGSGSAVGGAAAASSAARGGLAKGAPPAGGPAVTLLAARSDAHALTEMARAMALLCRLVAELAPQRAPAILSKLWRIAGTWLVRLPEPKVVERVVLMLRSLGSLLLHEYPGESEAALRRASGGGSALPADCRTVAFTAALQAGVVKSLAGALRCLLKGAEDDDVPANGFLVLLECLLRRSCALPPMMAHADPAGVVRLLETIRVAAETIKEQSKVLGRTPQATGEFACAKRNMDIAALQLLEHTTAVCMRARPEGLRGDSGSSSSSSSSSGEGTDGSSSSSSSGHTRTGGGVAAGPTAAPGAATTGALAAAIDSTAAALLTKSSRETVPKQRLRLMWLMTHHPQANAMAVMALSRLLPTLSCLRQADLSEPATSKDVLLGLMRVFTAVALQLLRGEVSRALESTCAAHTSAHRQVAAMREARAESWRLLLTAEEGVALTRVAAVLAAATKRQWPEGVAAALDLLEVLALALPAEDLAESLQLLGADGSVAQQAPSSPALPLRLCEGWLRQQGRTELVAVLEERGCHVPPGAAGGSRSGGSAGSTGSVGTGRRHEWLSTAAGAELLRVVAGKHQLASVQEVPAPAEVVWSMRASWGITICARPGCLQLDLDAVRSSHCKCLGCATAAYCSAECQQQHLLAGHCKAECACMRQVREACEGVYIGGGHL